MLIAMQFMFTVAMSLSLLILHSVHYNTCTTLTACTNLNYRCANKQCVSWAYRCDGQNDCGCTGLGCDENSCGGFDISE